jgi:hypothetical protein
MAARMLKLKMSAVIDGATGIAFISAKPIIL